MNELVSAFITQFHRVVSSAYRETARINPKPLSDRFVYLHHRDYREDWRGNVCYVPSYKMLELEQLVALILQPENHYPTTVVMEIAGTLSDRTVVRVAWSVETKQFSNHENLAISFRVEGPRLLMENGEIRLDVADLIEYGMVGPDFSWSISPEYLDLLSSPKPEDRASRYRELRHKLFGGFE